MATQVTIGTLGVIFGADVSGLVRGARTVEQRLQAVERAASNVSNRMKAAFLAVAGPAALGFLIKSSIDAVSAQKDLAERLGVSVAGVQVMGRAAELAGMSTEAFNKAADRLNRSIGTALADKTSQQADAFKKLGLSAEQLKNMDLDQRFAALSTRMEQLNLSAPQMANFLKEIGIRSGEMANLFISGAAGIAAARKELEIFGLVNTNEQAASIEAAGDAMSTFKLAAQGIGNALATEMSPYIVQAAQDFTDLAESADGVRGIVKEGADAIFKFGGAVANVGVQIKYEIEQWEKAFVDTVNAIIDGVNKVRNLPGISWLGGQDIQKITGIGDIFDTTTNKIILSDEELREKIGRPLPSDYIDAWRMKSEKAAKENSATWAAEQEKRRKAHAAGMDAIGSKEAEALKNKFEALKISLADEGEALILHNQKIDKEAKELLAKRVITQQQYNDLRLKLEDDYQKKLRESLWSNIVSTYATEQEQLAHQHQQKLEKLAEFNAAQLAQIGGFEAAKAALEQKYAEDYVKMMAQKYTAAAGVVESAMSHLSGVISTESKSGFNIMKAASIAIALVKGYEAVVSAWATGNATGIPGMGATLAGITAAAVAAQIAKISSTSIGSKGGASSGGGGGRGRGNATQSQPAAAPQQSMVVSGFNANEWLKGDAVRGIVKEIVKFQNDGGKVIVQ